LGKQCALFWPGYFADLQLYTSVKWSRLSSCGRSMFALLDMATIFYQLYPFSNIWSETLLTQVHVNLGQKAEKMGNVRFGM